MLKSAFYVQIFLLLGASMIWLEATSAQGTSHPSDVVQTSKGELRITPIFHGSFMLQFDGKAIHVDPWREGNYSGLPQADMILVTDIHDDHQDNVMINRLKKPGTIIVAPQAVAQTVDGAQTISNGEKKSFGGIEIEAVPMYNLVRGPEAGKFFHDKGRGNGYVLTLGDKRVYVSGDTECTPEMKALENIDIAFVVMNLPYTMPPAEAATCVNAFRPKIMYPFHFRGSEVQEFTDAVKGTPGVEVRLRKWY